ncbi:xanthine dehydrogenase-like [Chrysoperla carnea]|uniref:xanthine dehydrogenase-like n=1 Tax=Chrysoperla carnea TaxID=189513 RepID=UPI001D077A95|nr:xanthine dehydrogenase-like [Chrysoperla carnea]
MGSGPSNILGDNKSTTPVHVVTFKINGKEYVVHPDGVIITVRTTLNTFIRDVANLKGTKLMCLEGGCGSCIAVVDYEQPLSKRKVTLAFNTCLVTVLQCHGWNITTVEGIGNQKDGYSIVQKRLAEYNGSQCGMCSPGMVMNMFALYQTENNLTDAQIENSFGGNICRCTGYRTIADGFKSLTTDDRSNATPTKCSGIVDVEDMKLCSKNTYECLLKDVESFAQVYINSGSQQWYKVYTLTDLFAILKQIGSIKYMLVAGNTAHGVYRTDPDITVFIDINAVVELYKISISDTISIGANTTLSDILRIFPKIASQKSNFNYFAEIVYHVNLVAHIPVRNLGTIGGSLMLKHEHQRFQSDIFLLLETFGAQINIATQEGGTLTTVTPKDFLNLNMAGKVIVDFTFVQIDNTYIYNTYKIMPRAQNALAIVNAGFLMKMKSDMVTVSSATIVYGNINKDFVHATNTEQFLVGKNLFDNSVLQQAIQTLESELHCDEHPPDPPPKARQELAIALFYKFVLSKAPKDLVDPRYLSGKYEIERPVSSGQQKYTTDKSEYPLTEPVPKLEAMVQCSGEAKYVIDQNMLRYDFLYSKLILAHALPGSKIIKIDSTEALKMDGVIAVYTKDDIPGINTFTPEFVTLLNEEIFCDGEVKYNGQPAGIIVAKTNEIARNASTLIDIQYSDPPQSKQFAYTTRDALQIPGKPGVNHIITKHRKQTGNDVQKVINGTFDIGLQYHYTLETQSCVCIPIEDGMDVYPSTQWMDLAQLGVAVSCKIPTKNINVYVRRVGGAYGSKIIRANLITCACAIAAHNLQKPVYLRMDMDDNMQAIGKRFPCSADYEVGVDNKGKIQYLNLSFYTNVGFASNENVSLAIVGAISNVYDDTTWEIKAYVVHTDTPANCFCRGPGTTEAIAMAETVMEHIGSVLNISPADVRLANISKQYDQIPVILDRFAKESNIAERQKAVDEFNKNNRWKKRGIGLGLMKFTIVFYGSYYSHVAIYHGDGNVVISHGGIEMGQGINTKAAQVAASIFGIDLSMVQVKPSNILVSPNNTVTAGSTGSDSVVYATMQACKQLLANMDPVRQKMIDHDWKKLVRECNLLNIDLQATYQVTPRDIKNYDIYGVTFSEVEIDLLTGLHQILRVDLLEDVGESLSPLVDVGQIEGAFIMGLGYWLHEDMKYDENTGQLLNVRSLKYHPPGLKDIPIDWRIQFRQKSASDEGGVLRSKATGEPALCMSVSVAYAIRHALAAARKESDPNSDPWVRIYGPTTQSEILLSSLPNHSQYVLN